MNKEVELIKYYDLYKMHIIYRRRKIKVFVGLCSTFYII